MATDSGGPPSWREAIEAERRRRPRHTPDERAALRRLTVGAAAVALGLNVVLFVQTGVQQVGTGGLQDAIVSAAGSLFPGGGLRSSSQPPAAASPGTGAVTTGSS